MTPLQSILKSYRDPAHWHLNYETVKTHGAVLPDTPEGERPVAAVCNRQANSNGGAGRLESAATYRVTKMKVVNGLPKLDLSVKSSS